MVTTHVHADLRVEGRWRWCGQDYRWTCDWGTAQDCDLQYVVPSLVLVSSVPIVSEEEDAPGSVVEVDHRRVVTEAFGCHIHPLTRWHRLRCHSPCCILVSKIALSFAEVQVSRASSVRRHRAPRAVRILPTEELVEKFRSIPSRVTSHH